MTESGNSENKRDDLETAALATSATIIVFFLIYWAAQIESAYSLLALAYDW
ncbi:MAG: hypothetical protein R3F41_03050 [Gammaproteobacteria bacterium]|nr:hypothetical protein [Pseudomonadales bacterium]MCP5345728.1 hypothetical protein [Pseudomonadales bacterium]